MVDEICLNDALLEGTKEVFETMIFMDLKEATGPMQTNGDDFFLGSITFKGNLEGCLAICCNSQCAQTVAHNMLGIDPGDNLTEDDISDAVGEVTNMVMGSVKSRILDFVGNLDVSIPMVIRGKKLDNSLGENANKISKTINIEDEHSAVLSLLYREKL